MILLDKFTQDGVKIPVALPINGIMEVTPNAYHVAHSWIRYSDGQSVRSMVVVGTVEELVQRIHNIKRSYMGY